MNLLAFLGIGNAYAETAATATPAAAGGAQGLMSFLPMLIILVLFMYFIVIRPQSKRAKEHRNLMSALKKGEEVLTSGGIVGKVEKITDDFIILNIAEGINVCIQKNAVINTLPKGTIKSI